MIFMSYFHHERQLIIANKPTVDTKMTVPKIDI